MFKQLTKVLGAAGIVRAGYSACTHAPAGVRCVGCLSDGDSAVIDGGISAVKANGRRTVGTRESEKAIQSWC